MTRYDKIPTLNDVAAVAGVSTATDFLPILNSTVLHSPFAHSAAF